MLHLIVGNTGAGKTTYALDLQKRLNGVHFALDDWNKTLFLPDKTQTDGLEWFIERINRSEVMICKIITQLEPVGVDSILDLGFAKELHRAKFKTFAQTHNYKIQIHYLDVPTEIRRERIAQRNHNKGATYAFELSDSDFQFMEKWFEPLTAEEMLHAKHISSSE